MTQLVTERAIVIPKLSKNEKHVFKCRNCKHIYTWNRYVKHVKTSRHIGVECGEVQMTNGPSGIGIQIIWI